MKINSIGVFNLTLTHKIGGTESYTAYLIQELQNLFPEKNITILSEKNLSRKEKYTSSEVVQHLNNSFGTKIFDKNIKVKEIFNKNRISFLINFYKESSKFDLFFNCSVNMLCPNGKYNISITHFPDKQYLETNFAKNPLGRMIAKIVDTKIKNSYKVYFCNSNFTAYWLKRKWNPKNAIKVLPPPCKMIDAKPLNKSNIILVCSRIEESKKLEYLIEAFKKLDNRDIKLIIAGSCTSTLEKNYFEQLKDLSINQNIEFIINSTRSELENLFRKAKYFWHAKGYGEDEEENPYKMEHFGITTVEAMSAGCIPIVINKGGQKEIVDENINGFKWNTIEELIEKTNNIINETSEKTNSFQEAAIKKANSYSVKEFNEKLIECIKDFI